MIILGVLIAIGLIIAFFMMINGERSVERMQDQTLLRLERILSRQVVLNMNAGSLGTDKDMKDHAKLKAVQTEIERRSALVFASTLHKTYNETVEELAAKNARDTAPE